MGVKLDSEGRNTEAAVWRSERRFRHDDIRVPKREDRGLEIGFWAVMIGFLVAGVVALLSGHPIQGIG